MKPIELLEVIGDARDTYIHSAGACRVKKNPSRIRNKHRVWLIAAIIAVSMLIMGSAVINRLTLATAPEYPLIQSAEISPESINLSVSDVTPTSMQIHCSIDGVVEGVNDIFMQIEGPFILEKQTEEGWEPLDVKIQDPTWILKRLYVPTVLRRTYSRSLTYIHKRSGRQHRFSHSLYQGLQKLYKDRNLT